MSIDRAVLARYLKQLAELGIDDLVLEEMTAREASDIVAGRSVAAAAGARTATPAARSSSATQPAPVETPRQSAPGASPDSADAAAIAPQPASPVSADAAAIAPQPSSPVSTGAAAIAPQPASPGSAGAAAIAPQPASPVEDIQPAASAGSSSAALSPGVAVPAGNGALSVLQSAAGVCARCGLHATRTNVVFGEGNPAADVVVVGEAPGQEEDLSGRPFVGRAGKLLDLLLMTAGFPRENVYICNVLKCRPPNNRNPQADEVSACTTSFLFGQLDAIQPKVLLAVGKFAAQALLESDESISRLRGVKHSYRGTPLIVTYHPAYLLRSPQMTRVAWQDFQLLRKVLHEQARG